MTLVNQLASLTNPDLILQTVMSVLMLQETNPNEILSSLFDYLASRELLLVFDNCEHLVDVCAQLIDQILQRCPGVKVLATSRETLEVGGEIVYQVPSLSIPDPEANKDIDDLTQYESLGFYRSRQIGESRLRRTRMLYRLQNLLPWMDPVAIATAARTVMR
jgi:predicted ATPase